MNLEVTYLGMKLKNPLMTGASPLTDSLDFVKKLEDAGAGALVLRSLFEEQIEMEERAFHHHVVSHSVSSAESSSGFLPDFSDFAFDSEHYLTHIQKVKSSVDIPVIASLNGISSGGWERYSKLMEEAGADALELNFYDLPTESAHSCVDVEARYIEILKNIRALVKIPLAIKLSPFFSSLPHFAKQLMGAGANGIILFNRLYQPDIDIEKLQVKPTLSLSDSSELALRLRWLAILESHFKGSMAASGGVHTTVDVIKSLMTGATTIQMVSALMKNGPGHFTKIENELKAWLIDHEYESLQQMCGSMSLRACPDPSAFGRTNYMKILHGWNVLSVVTFLSLFLIGHLVTPPGARGDSKKKAVTESSREILLGRYYDCAEYTYPVLEDIPVSLKIAGESVEAPYKGKDYAHGIDISLVVDEYCFWISKELFFDSQVFRHTFWRSQ